MLKTSNAFFDDYGRVKPGAIITIRFGNEVWRRFVLTLPQCEDALRKQVAPLGVMTVRHPLGRLILGKQIGFEARYTDENGNECVAWIEAIERGPVLKGGARSGEGEIHADAELPKSCETPLNSRGVIRPEVGWRRVRSLRPYARAALRKLRAGLCRGRGAFRFRRPEGAAVKR